MIKNKINLDLNRYEINIIINALNEFRNNLLEKEIDTDAINEILLKVIDASEKKNLLLKGRNSDER